MGDGLETGKSGKCSKDIIYERKINKKEKKSFKRRKAKVVLSIFQVISVSHVPSGPSFFSLARMEARNPGIRTP